MSRVASRGDWFMVVIVAAYLVLLAGAALVAGVVALAAHVTSRFRAEGRPRLSTEAECLQAMGDGQALVKMREIR